MQSKSVRWDLKYVRKCMRFTAQSRKWRENTRLRFSRCVQALPLCGRGDQLKEFTVSHKPPTQLSQQKLASKPKEVRLKLSKMN